MNTQEQLDNDLIQAAKHGNLINVKSLIEQGADIHAKNDESLIMSARDGHLEVVKYLVEHGADIHSYKDQALRWSAENGRLEVVRYLFEQGADMHACNDCALKWSAKYGHLEVVKYLVIDCNMVIDKETLEYLKKEKLSEIINIVKSRDLYININNKLDNSSNYKTRLKI
jgi:ankyrin repeat protein